jgi:pre-mRNA-splicing helicase BRR2
MEMCQMAVQAQWAKDSPLLQLPHVTAEVAAAAAAADVSTVFDLADMEADQRRELLQLSEAKLEEVGAVLARYPDINLSHELPEGGAAVAGEPVTLLVSLEREMEGTELAPVHAPHFPGRREEGWWLVVGDSASNRLLGIKRVSFAKSTRVKLTFDAPPTPGKAALTLFFMCDSWLGCDQEYEVELDVSPAEEEEASQDDGEEGAGGMSE